MQVETRSEAEIRRVDAAGRLSIGREKVGTAYAMTEADDGTVTLVPVTIVPTRELWLHRNREAREALLRGILDSAEGRSRDGGEFGQYLDDVDGD